MVHPAYLLACLHSIASTGEWTQPAGNEREKKEVKVRKKRGPRDHKKERPEPKKSSTRGGFFHFKFLRESFLLVRDFSDS